MVLIFQLSFCFLGMFLAAWLNSALVDAASKTLEDAFQRIQDFYDKLHPPQYNQSQLKPHHHHKRCIIQETRDAITRYTAGDWKGVSGELEILVSSPCMGSDSIGNNLGVYFESISCANRAGLHYVAVAKVWEPKRKDKPTTFFNALPTVVEHPSPVAQHQTQLKLQEHCKCPGSCHERKVSAWVKSLDTIKPLFVTALEAHLKSPDSNIPSSTLVTTADKSTAQIGSSLPLIPDAAIHYRCGDNWVGHYGFLPFKAFDRIPQESKTIYILAERRSRKTDTKLAAKCDAILFSLFNYMTAHYPNAEVLLRRGDDLYLDMARLTFANTTVCSVSTFCLWPAVANRGKAYFPLTKLIVGGDSSVNLGFQWITDVNVVLGAAHTSSPIQQLISKLGGSTANPPIPRPEHPADVRDFPAVPKRGDSGTGNPRKRPKDTLQREINEGPAALRKRSVGGGLAGVRGKSGATDSGNSNSAYSPSSSDATAAGSGVGSTGKRRGKLGPGSRRKRRASIGRDPIDGAVESTIPDEASER
jgi:hypothetical protein